MGIKTVRMFICAVLAAGFGMFGTASHAGGVVHSVPFDPDNFLGFINVEIPLACVGTPNTLDPACLVTFLSVDFTDNLGNHWVTGSPSYTEPDPVLTDANGLFFALAATLTSPFLGLASDSNGCFNGESETQTLTFELPNDGNGFTRRVSFSCLGVVGDNVGLYTTPEPAPLALLGLGLAGLAVSRRRKLM